MIEAMLTFDMFVTRLADEIGVQLPSGFGPSTRLAEDLEFDSIHVFSALVFIEDIVGSSELPHDLAKLATLGDVFGIYRVAGASSMDPPHG